MCDFNKNQLLTLFFHEGEKEEEERTQNHVNECKDCQDFLQTLKQTDHTLGNWSDELPDQDMFASILKDLPETGKQSTMAKSYSLKPMILIVFAIMTFMATIFLIHNKISSLQIWQTVKEWSIFQLVGTFGVTSILLIMVGIIISLSILPILIIEQSSSKSRLGFN